MGACPPALRCPVLAAAASSNTRSALCSMGRAVSQHKASTARQRQAAHAGDTHGGRCWCISLQKSTGATACAAEWEGYAEQCCQCHVALGAARCTVAEEARACAALGRALWVATLTGPAAAVEAGEGGSLPALPPADSDSDTGNSSGSASSGTHSGSNIDGMIAAAVEVLLPPEMQAGSATAARVMGAGSEAPAEATLAAVGAATPHEEEEAVAALLAYASVHVALWDLAFDLSGTRYEISPAARHRRGEGHLEERGVPSRLNSVDGPGLVASRLPPVWAWVGSPWSVTWSRRWTSSSLLGCV